MRFILLRVKCYVNHNTEFREKAWGVDCVWRSLPRPAQAPGSPLRLRHTRLNPGANRGTPGVFPATFRSIAGPKMKNFPPLLVHGEVLPVHT